MNISTESHEQFDRGGAKSVSKTIVVLSLLPFPDVNKHLQGFAFGPPFFKERVTVLRTTRTYPDIYDEARHGQPRASLPVLAGRRADVIVSRHQFRRPHTWRGSMIAYCQIGRYDEHILCSG